MTPVYLDYETYWDDQHSLSKMTAIEYVMHSKTEVQSVAIAVGEGDVEVVFGEHEIHDYLNNMDWSDKICIAHNGNEFDHLITACVFGIEPAMWGDTLAMARPIHAKGVGGSLKALADYYGLQAKGSLEATNTKGKRLKDFTPEELAAMKEYNKGDTIILRDLFKILVRKTPKLEMRLIDLTARMLVEPKFELDVDLLMRGLRAERHYKRVKLEELGEILGAHPDDLPKILSSSAKFRDLLTRLGVEVPMKVSPF